MTTQELVHVRVGGHSIAYRLAGEGPAIVLLHGFLCDSRCWRRQLTDLADRFTIVAWDAPGAGSSTDPPEPFTLSQWADTLAAFLDVIGIGRAHVLGLSWGGMLAQEMLRLHPGRVDRLMLCDTYAGWKWSFSEGAVEKRRARCNRDAARPGEEVAEEWVPADFFVNAPEELVAEMRGVVADFHPVGFRLMTKVLADDDTSSVLPIVTAPTLLVWGEGDLRSPLAVAEQFHQVLPQSELHVIAGAGHVSNMERPDEFNAIVRRFLSKP